MSIHLITLVSQQTKIITSNLISKPVKHYTIKNISTLKTNHKKTPILDERPLRNKSRPRKRKQAKHIGKGLKRPLRVKITL